MQLAKQKKASTLFFLATDTGLQDAACPAGIALGDVFMSMRAHNVASGVTTKANEELLANFKKTGTPYADLTHEDFNDKPVW
jgi:Fe-S oxidoreductase